jgi:aspartokinase
LIVQKFGGTSIEDAASVERVCEIVAAARERCPVVVVSAIG